MPSSYLKSYLKRFGAGVQWREWRVENKRVLCITGTFWRTECAHCSLLRWSSRAGGPRSPRAGCLAWCLKLAPEAGAWEQPRVGFWVGSRARDFPTERVLSRTPLIIRTVDQKNKTKEHKRKQQNIHVTLQHHPTSSCLLPVSARV